MSNQVIGKLHYKENGNTSSSRCNQHECELTTGVLSVNAGSTRDDTRNQKYQRCERRYFEKRIVKGNSLLTLLVPNIYFIFRLFCIFLLATTGKRVKYVIFILTCGLFVKEIIL